MSNIDKYIAKREKLRKQYAATNNKSNKEIIKIRGMFMNAAIQKAEKRMGKRLLPVKPVTTEEAEDIFS